MDHAVLNQLLTVIEIELLEVLHKLLIPTVMLSSVDQEILVKLTIIVIVATTPIREVLLHIIQQEGVEEITLLFFLDRLQVS